MATKYLGRPMNEPINELDTFPSPSIDRVTMTSDEVTAFCPITKQPDFYTVTIEYEPNQLCIESKSLKLYLMHFRTEFVFAEALTVEIKNKVIETIQPKFCYVTVIQKSRGGIVIKAESRYAA